MRRLKKYLVYLMTGGTLLMICGVFPKKSTITAVEEYGISNPIVENGVTTCDCIYFENYLQDDTNCD